MGAFTVSHPMMMVASKVISSYYLHASPSTLKVVLIFKKNFNFLILKIWQNSSPPLKKKKGKKKKKPLGK
jgi:hypothetical protein